MPQQRKASGISWKELVERRFEDLPSSPSLVKVININDVTSNVVENVRLGDELFVGDVTITDIRLHLDEGQDQLPRDGITLSTRTDINFLVCPHFDDSHVFNTVGEVIDVYPAITNVIFPTTQFLVEGTEIIVAAWEELKIIKTVLGSPEDFLEMSIVKNSKRILLPAKMKIEFIQRKNVQLAFDATTMGTDEDQKLFSLTELANEIWSTDRWPLRVRLPQVNEPQLEQIEVNQGNGIWGKLRGKSKGNCLDSVSPSSPRQPTFNMIPNTWWCKTMILEPILLADVTNTTVTSRSFLLSGDVDMMVTELISTPVKPRCDVINPCDVITGPPTVPLYKLNLDELQTEKGRNNAIVAVVMNTAPDSDIKTRKLSQQWIALHTAKHVPKFLMTSKDNQHYLVSPSYRGIFSKQSIYNMVADIPVTQEYPFYLIGVSAKSEVKGFDSCLAGNYVRFFDLKCKVEKNGKVYEFATCQVSTSPDAPPRPACFLLSLRGEFQLFSTEEMTVHDLKNATLPLQVCVAKQDRSLGFDPLAMKELTVKEIITETTVTIEQVKKINDKFRARDGAMEEVSAHRSTLLLREHEGAGMDTYPRRFTASSVLKLPSVELLSDQGVCKLRKSLGPSVPTRMMTPIRPPKPPQYLKNFKYSVRRPKTFKKTPAPKISRTKFHSHSVEIFNDRDFPAPQNARFNDREDFPNPKNTPHFNDREEFSSQNVTSSEPSSNNRLRRISHLPPIRKSNALNSRYSLSQLGTVPLVPTEGDVFQPARNLTPPRSPIQTRTTPHAVIEPPITGTASPNISPSPPTIPARQDEKVGYLSMKGIQEVLPSPSSPVYAKVRKFSSQTANDNKLDLNDKEREDKVAPLPESPASHPVPRPRCLTLENRGRKDIFGNPLSPFNGFASPRGSTSSDVFESSPSGLGPRSHTLSHGERFNSDSVVDHGHTTYNQPQHFAKNDDVRCGTTSHDLRQDQQRYTSENDDARRMTNTDDVRRYRQRYTSDTTGQHTPKKPPRNHKRDKFA